MATMTKTGRISVKVPPAASETLSKAAELSGTTLDGFLMRAALKEARRIIEDESSRQPDDPALLLNFSISRMGPRRR
jgi:uncharacterized protein (DUF1778 family)